MPRGNVLRGSEWVGVVLVRCVRIYRWGYPVLYEDMRICRQQEWQHV